MSLVLTHAGIAVATIFAMEGAAWAAHKYVMHGWGWGWHASHHRTHDDLLEKNDLYALVSAALAVALFVAAPSRGHFLYWVAVGITAYGVLYALLHDGLVHRRWPAPRAPRNRYLQRLIRAHRLHHATTGRDGAVSFGFLYAPPLPALLDRMRHLRAHKP